VIALTLAEVAELTGPGGAAVTGAVTLDSRAVASGDLFVAVAGERADGHDFLAAAAAAGAVGAISSRPDDALPCVVVADPVDALGRLASGVHARLVAGGLQTLAITGSSGKTSTKDMIGQLLAQLGPTIAPAGSFNNGLGLPHTVLMADEQTRFLVLEMGARGIGHLAYPTQIAPPTIGVVINVGVAHIGEFGSVEAIAQAKGELVEALPAGGLAVLNADDPLVAAMASRTQAAVWPVGLAPESVVRATDVRLDERGRAAYTLVTEQGETAVTLRVAGAHQVGNSLAAAAVALRAGLPVAECGAALSRLGLVSSRRMDVFRRADGVTVIDDSYNANPASMAAALQALSAMAGDRRTIAVLGYMAELGGFERDGHEQVGRLAAELGVDVLIAVGDNAAPISSGAAAADRWGGEAVQVSDQDEATEALRARLRPGDVVLVKGSRYRTWQVADALREPASEGIAEGAAA
jgi:UDP-N-acetylmuramoyl-tripeptide--D-alanyl-D-alanine ligase